MLLNRSHLRVAFGCDENQVLAVCNRALQGDVLRQELHNLPALRGRAGNRTNHESVKRPLTQNNDVSEKRPELQSPALPDRIPGNGMYCVA